MEELIGGNKMLSKLNKVVTLLSFTLSAQVLAETKAPLKEVNVCIPQSREELVILQVMLAKEKAMFEKNGIKANFIIKPFTDKLNISSFPQGEKDVKMLQNKNVSSLGLNRFKDEDKCDFITTSIESFFFKPQTMEKYKPLQLVAYGDSYDTNLVVSKDSPYKSLKDLKGKKIRVGFIATIVALEEMLKREGMSMNDVIINRTMMPTEVHAALESKKIDAAITYFPTMHALLTSGKVRIIKKDIYNNFMNTPSPKSLCFVDKKFNDKNPEVVAAFKKTLKEAQAFGNENPSQLALILKNHSKELKLSEWDISNANIEKINEIYTNVNSIDFENETMIFKGKKMTAFEILESYNDKLIETNYVNNKLDLSKWK